MGPELGPGSPAKVVNFVFFALDLIFHSLPLRLSSFVPKLDFRVLMLKISVGSLMNGWEKGPDANLN